MEGSTVLIIVFALIFFLLVTGVPIAFCIFSGGILGLLLLGGSKLLIGFFSYSIHHLMASYPLAVGPMFILVGTLADVGGLGERCYNAFHTLLGHLRGGLLMATTAAAAVFGACSGSSVASAALFSKLALPELRKLSYQEEISLGAIATAGGLATLIPPSMMVVFYGILTNTSVGRVLIAGIIPGIILTIILMVAIFIRIKLDPKIAPVLVHGSTWREKVVSVIGAWPILAIFLVIVGGIYTGFCTPSEAGSVGAAVVLLYAVIRRTSVKNLIKAFYDATALTSQIFILIIGGQMLSKVVSLSGVTHDILTWMVTSNLSLSILWTLFIILYLVLGCIIDPISMLVLTLPFCFPILTKLGVDPIALGIVVILMVEVAVITPPIGFNVYVVAATAGVDPMVAFRGSTMFFFLLLLMVIIVILFPSLSTWLPNLAFQ